MGVRGKKPSHPHPLPPARCQQAQAGVVLAAAAPDHSEPKPRNQQGVEIRFGGSTTPCFHACCISPPSGTTTADMAGLHMARPAPLLHSFCSFVSRHALPAHPAPLPAQQSACLASPPHYHTRRTDSHARCHRCHARERPAQAGHDRRPGARSGLCRRRPPGAPRWLPLPCSRPPQRHCAW